MSKANSQAGPRITFGQLAVRKGYVSQQQVEEALSLQRAINQRDGKHKLIGLIMLEMGLLGTTELIEVLKGMDGRDAATTIYRPAARARTR